ncbi:hypothetical protein [Niastella populi]|nr:hypothetical protein [Niastella populi]
MRNREMKKEVQKQKAGNKNEREIGKLNNESEAVCVVLVFH